MFQHGATHEGIWETRAGSAVGRADVAVAVVVAATAVATSMPESAIIDERYMIMNIKLQ